MLRFPSNEQLKKFMLEQIQKIHSVQLYLFLLDTRKVVEFKVNNKKNLINVNVGKKSYFTIPHTSSSFILSLKWLGISFTKLPFLFGSCCVCHSYQINDIVLPYINVHM